MKFQVKPKLLTHTQKKTFKFRVLLKTLLELRPRGKRYADSLDAKKVYRNRQNLDNNVLPLLKITIIDIAFSLKLDHGRFDCDKAVRRHFRYAYLLKDDSKD